MSSLYAIGWFITLVIFHFVGFSGLTSMFPEGERGWHFPAQIASLVFFAIVILANPFITWVAK